MQIKLDTLTVTTTQAKVDAARFSCAFTNSLMRPLALHRIRIDGKGVVRCEHCGQTPHETSVPVLFAQLN